MTIFEKGWRLGFLGRVRVGSDFEVAVAVLTVAVEALLHCCGGGGGGRLPCLSAAMPTCWFLFYLGSAV